MIKQTPLKVSGSDKKKSSTTELKAQKKRLIEALTKARGKGITTIQARNEINVMHPGGRIYELRHQDGFNIQTLWSVEFTPDGLSHRVARYVLFPGEYGEVIL